MLRVGHFNLSRNDLRQHLFIFIIKITEEKNYLLKIFNHYYEHIYCLELDDETKLVYISAPCTRALKQTCPLMNVLNEYKSQEDEMQYELDFTYLEPFVTYENYERFCRVHYRSYHENYSFQAHRIVHQKQTIVSVRKEDNSAKRMHFDGPLVRRESYEQRLQQPRLLAYPFSFNFTSAEKVAIFLLLFLTDETPRTREGVQVVHLQYGYAAYILIS